MLPKKGKKRLLLKNLVTNKLIEYRLQDYSNILAMRMQEVLLSIINFDQSGYLKGHYKGQNIRILKDVSFNTNQNKLPGILLSVDSEKAFDSLNWNFLFKTLEHANFGNIFIGYIKTMYNNV